ncbi:hypothetical protein [Robertkochia solimangrovi]|uniref:hypothetical protein n=1 Tax=Robertkochia solimangrovi TaxID=2213046 RepID=UPI00117F9A5F|nr:hypothetical protein [Robertkochia solimangrovi]TRZ46129.1 hypothetical protein DMZ48_02380 [Robertkochia solimangrovi]
MKNSEVSKATIILFCREQLARDISGIRTQLLDIEEALSGETKSTAGDKHETGRAMLQLDREQLGERLLKAEKAQQEFERLLYGSDPKELYIRPGKLVCTDKGYFFIGPPLGKLNIDDVHVFAISPGSPLAIAFMGRGAGDHLDFRETIYRIISVD